RLAMPLPRVVGVAVGSLEDRAREVLAARVAVLRQEVRPQAIHEAAKSGLPLTRPPSHKERGPFRPAMLRHQRTYVRGQHRELWMMARPVVEKRVEAITRCYEPISQLCGGGAARGVGRQILRAFRQVPAERLRRDEAPVEERSDAGA